MTLKSLRDARTIPAWIGIGLTTGVLFGWASQGLPPFTLVERWSVGVLSGDQRFEFGNIEAMAISEDGKYVFVLDRLNSRVAAFSHSGAFIGSAGRPGRGPGEFQYASAVVSRDSIAMVVDAATGRMSSWVVRGNSLEMKAEVSGTAFLETRAACSLGGSLILLRWSAGKILHQVTTDGVVEKSFGLAFTRDAHPMMGAATTFGYVACDRRQRSVYVAATEVPVVRRYRENGALVWETSIPNMHPPVISAVGAGIRYSPPEGRVYPQLVASLFTLGDSLVVVQFGDSSREIAQASEITQVTTLVLSSSNGRVLWQGNTLPKLDGAHGDRVFAHPSDPFPKVKVFEWRRQ